MQSSRRAAPVPMSSRRKSSGKGGSKCSNVFIELDEYTPKQKQWTETHRWNHGMEEDLVSGRWLAAPVPKGVGANPTALVQWGLTVSFTSGAEEAAVADIRRAFSLARRWQNPRPPHANPLWLGQ